MKTKKARIILFIGLFVTIVILSLLVMLWSINFELVSVETPAFIQPLFEGKGIDSAIGYRTDGCRIKRGETLNLTVYYAEYQSGHTHRTKSFLEHRYSVSYELVIDQSAKHFTYQHDCPQYFEVPKNYDPELFVYSSKYDAAFNVEALPFRFHLQLTDSKPFYTFMDGEIVIWLQSSAGGEKIALYYAADEDEICFSTVSVEMAKLKLGF